MEQLVQIANQRFLIKSNYDRFWPFAHRRYQHFVDTTDEQPDEIINLEVVDDLALPDHDVGSTSIRFVDKGNRVDLLHGRGKAIWDRAGHQCRIVQDSQDYRLGPDYQPDYVVGTMIRIMLSVRLLDEQGCLIHSAGLERGGKGYLFVGESGAGKSTLSRASAPVATVLSDDLPLVTLVDGEPFVHGTPFVGDFEIGRANVTAPLHGIYFLHQAAENCVTPVPKKDAIRQMLRSIVSFGQDRHTAQSHLEFAGLLCEKTPCYRLDFRPDASFWRWIDA